MHAITKALAGAATLALVGFGVPAAMADTAVGPDATLVGAAPLPSISLGGRTYWPGAYGLDVDGDKQADRFGYCVEPGVSTNSAVRSQTQQLAAYDSSARSFIQDAGRVRWVAANGFGGVSGAELAQKAGITVDLTSGSADIATMQTATQLAIWRFSSGLVPGSTWRYGSTTAANAKFWAVYTYLVRSATSLDTAAVVYDEKAGEAKTQAIIVVPTPKPTPAPEPTKTTEPAPEPTKTPCPDTCPTTEPTTTTAPATWTPGPDALRVSASSSYRITMSNNAYSPSYAGFDITGDRVADIYGYCMEPYAPTSSGVLAWTQKFAAYDSATRSDWKDGGRVRWVASHGYGAVSGPELASTVGISVTMTSGSTDVAMLEAATQAAIWRFTSGLVVNPLWRFGYTSADNAKFWKVYNYLVQNATPVDAKTTVYDEKAGEAKTQGYVIVTPPAPAPTPEPTKTPCPDTCPTSEPTKTPCPDTCPTSEPTKTPCPDTCPTSDPTKIG